MTWDQVRHLRRRGVEVGSHTRTHRDRGSVTGDRAQQEIIGGRQQLEERIDLFAYPYGGSQHMAEASREFVKATGFRCCCSCYGGVTNSGDDPFHLQRVAISPWYATPYQSVSSSSGPEGRKPVSEDSVLRNIGSNWAVTLVSIAVTYVVTPFIIYTLGHEVYGTWTLIIAITGYMTLLSLRVPTGLITTIYDVPLALRWEAHGACPPSSPL